MLPGWHYGARDFVPISTYQSHEREQVQRLRPFEAQTMPPPALSVFHQPQPQTLPRDMAERLDVLGSGLGAPLNLQGSLRAQAHDPRSHSQTAFQPQSRNAIDVNLGSSSLGSGAPPNVQEQPPSQPASNNPTRPSNHGPNEQSSITVLVNWCFDKTHKTQEFDLSKPATHLRDDTIDFLEENLELDLQLYNYRLKFCLPPAEEVTPFIFKKNVINEQVGNIMTWMQTIPDKQRVTCTITQFTRPLRN